MSHISPFPTNLPTRPLSEDRRVKGIASNAHVPWFFSGLFYSIALLCCASVSLLFSGCGNGQPSGGGGTNPSPTVTIAANPASIVSGSSSTLTVSATNATQVTVTGSDGSKYTLQPSGGTQSVKPSKTTTYTATASGSGGTNSATATVTVGAPAAPTVTIVTKPTSISAGSSSTLTVTATNATQVIVTGSDGTKYTLQPTGGSPSVTPATTTTYTATATGTGGTATATATVTVVANAPTVTITANPTSMVAGASSTLTVAAQNATQVTVTGTDGSSYKLTPTGGIQSVVPAATTTYTATATGPGGTVTATATLTVTPNPPPTITMTANPTSIVSGNSSVLTVASSNATTVTITGSDGSSYTLTGTTNGQPGTSGLQTVTPTATTTYTATATGPGGTTTATATVTVTPNPSPTVTISANPATITSGNSSTLTVTAANAASVMISGTDGSSYTLTPTGGTQAVSPTATTTYTATATGTGTTGSATDSTTVTVTAPGSIDSINHVIFMMQENRTFDSYFGMLNPYRESQCTNAQGQEGPCATVGGQPWDVGDDGITYTVDGIDDKLNTITNTNNEGVVYKLFKLASTCIDDDSSAWQSSYADVSKGNYKPTRPILMNGFVHVAENFANSCANGGNGCSGAFTDQTGERAMGYYDQGFLNYYYYMASQFAISDRWFSPISTYTVNNRIATFSGGTTQGLVRDPENTDHLSQLQFETIFQELTKAGVSWKIYYTVTDGGCLDDDECSGGESAYPATDFSDFGYSLTYLRGMPASGVCPAPTQPSSVVGDAKNSFCIDPTHIAPLSDANYGYFADLQNGTLPSFAFIEPGYGHNDEHPSSGGNILAGQAEVAKIINALMTSSSWKDSVFFLSYDEGGGPYDHVPPVPGHSNDFTDASQVANYPVLSSTGGTVGGISVNPESNPSYWPCLPPDPATPTLHCDLPNAGEPGGNPSDAPAVQGFAAQIGFRMPNMVISPFTRRHYVSHIPMDHTAIIKFVENRFIGPSAHLTARDAAQPNLLDFFDFNAVPWATPPTPPVPDNASNTCNPANMGP